MRRLNLNAIILIGCVAVFVLLAYERTTIAQRELPSIFSTYDVGVNGYRALFEVLQTAGVPVWRFERPLGELDRSVRTLVITGYEYEDELRAKPLDANDAAFLRNFVRNGGRLVAIDPEFAGTSDAAPGVGSTVSSAGHDAIVIARNGLTDGVARVRGSIDWIFPLRERGLPLLANDKGMVAVWYRFGRGDVVAITAPALFGNDQLRNSDNLRFAYNVIAGRGIVAFDEYVHGYSDNLSMWGVLPAPVRDAVWIVVGIVLIALIGANVPFAPPYLPESAGDRTSSDYITAIAALMRRSRRRPPDDDVLRQATIDFQRRKEHA